MAFPVQKEDTYSIITSGVTKLDGRYSPELKAVLLNENSENTRNLILDLSETRYCDSSGLSAILIGNRLCKNSGGTFVLCGLSAMVSKLITLSQLDSILNITPTLDEAIQFILMEEAERQISDKD